MGMPPEGAVIVFKSPTLRKVKTQSKLESRHVGDGELAVADWLTDLAHVQYQHVQQMELQQCL